VEGWQQAVAVAGRIWAGIVGSFDSGSLGKLLAAETRLRRESLVH